ncbi:unnamed protein product [Closterium sp. NIES-54]
MIQCGALRLNCGLMRFNAVYCGSIHFNAVHCGSMRFNTFHFDSMRNDAIDCDSLLFDADRCGSKRSRVRPIPPHLQLFPQLPAAFVHSRTRHPLIKDAQSGRGPSLASFPRHRSSSALLTVTLSSSPTPLPHQVVEALHSLHPHCITHSNDRPSSALLTVSSPSPHPLPFPQQGVEALHLVSIAWLDSDGHGTSWTSRSNSSSSIHGYKDSRVCRISPEAIREVRKEKRF